MEIKSEVVTVREVKSVIISLSKREAELLLLVFSPLGSSQFLELTNKASWPLSRGIEKANELEGRNYPFDLHTKLSVALGLL